MALTPLIALCILCSCTTVKHIDRPFNDQALSTLLALASDGDLEIAVSRARGESTTYTGVSRLTLDGEVLSVAGDANPANKRPIPPDALARIVQNDRWAGAAQGMAGGLLFALVPFGLAFAAESTAPPCNLRDCYNGIAYALAGVAGVGSVLVGAIIGAIVGRHTIYIIHSQPRDPMRAPPEAGPLAAPLPTPTTPPGLPSEIAPPPGSAESTVELASPARARALFFGGGLHALREDAGGGWAVSAEVGHEVEALTARLVGSRAVIRGKLDATVLGIGAVGTISLSAAPSAPFFGAGIGYQHVAPTYDFPTTGGGVLLVELGWAFNRASAVRQRIALQAAISSAVTLYDLRWFLTF